MIGYFTASPKNVYPEKMQTTQVHREALLKKHWGYTSFRPFQEKTIQAILEDRDTLTILPTGGGKSLCFQIPALCKEGLTVVISPLISLMKDQVDGLKEMEISADCLNSSQTLEEQRKVFQKIANRTLKLLYLAPERLKVASTLDLLLSTPLSFFVIDEAHCISEWGHDFREDYRQLGKIKELFSQIPIHAFTATATPEVQVDILKELRLKNPEINVAPVDRDNLTYRIMARTKETTQVTRILEQHPKEPGIIYCIKRDDVDSLSKELNGLGFRNVAYHAGLSDETRRKHHDQFSREEVDLVVATVAFGMGIDRSNIRFVIHTSMPKNIEQYQQETGRAGRDGLPAACYLLYGGGDYRTWNYMLSNAKHNDVMMEKLKTIYRFCAEPRCRHKALVHYFGQKYDPASCKACDYCLGEIEAIADSLVVAQKILSCVMRVEQRFGADHVARVLKGDETPNIKQWKHQSLSTFGLLQDKSIAYIRSLIEQLIGQEFLRRESEYQTLSVTESGREAMRGNATPFLAQPTVTAKKKKEIEQSRKKMRDAEWNDIDEALFQVLRKKRMALATDKGVPAFHIFSDRSLREMAQKKPTTSKDFGEVHGVGKQKQEAYAKIFCSEIAQYLQGRQGCVTLEA